MVCEKPSEEGMSWTVNERENDWSLTWFEALIVTDCDKTDWEGDPDIIPVDGLRFNPIGSDPDDTENDILSPLIEGVIENDSYLVNANDDWWYDKHIGCDLMIRYIVLVNVRLPCCILIVITYVPDCVVDPEIKPFVWFRLIPSGNEPEVIV